MPINPDRLVPGGALLGPVAARLVRSAGEEPAELPSDCFGPFRAVREIGRGGMAVVYLGERVQGGFEQQVALKLVGVRGDPATLQSLFRRERQLLARLQHPNIARLLDGGQLADGRPWFALDLVDGERIDAWCRRLAPDTAARLRVFRQVCAAVAFAHARLVVHRDLKPSNIVVEPAGEAKLLDFGIAALLDDAGLALAPAQALTPGFASPEQLRGEPATTASDIWQLGRLLAVLLAQAPADAPEPAAAGATDGAAAAVPRSHVDPDLAAIVARACADDPAQRYVTVAALEDELERHRRRQPVLARHGGRAYRLGRFLSRYRWPVTGASLALLALAATALLFTLGLARERNLAAREAQRANAALGFLTGLFTVADPGVNRGERLSANAILQRGVEQLESELGGQPEVHASLLETIGRVHLGLGQLDRAAPLLLQSVQLSRALKEPAPVRLAERLRVLAQVQWRRGELAQARASSQEGLDLLGPGSDHPDLRARLLNTRAIVTLLLGDAVAAEQLQRQALAQIEATLGPDDANAGYGWNNLGRVLSDQARDGEAAAALQRAVTILQASLGGDHPDTLDIATSRARALGRAGHGEAALAELTSIQGGLERVLGRTDWRYGYTVLSAAEIHLRSGEQVPALALAQQAVAVYRRALGDENLYTAVAWELLGRVRSARSEHALALADFRQALRIRQAQLADDHLDLAMTRADVGRELCALGERDAGRALLQAALAVPRPPMGAAAALAACPPP